MEFHSKKRKSASKITAVLLFFGAMLMGYNNCGPQTYNSNSQNSTSACVSAGYNGPTLIVNGQMIPPQSSTSITVHAQVNQNISFSLFENGAPVPCGPPVDGLSYWVLPTGQQVQNTCISQASSINGSFVYTYHASEYINGMGCPPVVNNVSVQISVP